MKITRLVLLALIVAFATPIVFAQEEQHEDPIERQLFPPELMMQNRLDLGLTERQQATLKSEVQNAQSTFFDLQWQMNDESQNLVKLLESTPIDEAMVLEQVDKVMSLERQIKRTHLTLLVRLKNMLNDDQIAKLHRLKEEKRR